MEKLFKDEKHYEIAPSEMEIPSRFFTCWIVMKSGTTFVLEDKMSAPFKESETSSD